MSRVDLLEIIEDAILKYKKTVVIVSQCRRGFEEVAIQAELNSNKLGAILAEDMTIEAVIAKLSYVIGKGYKGNEIQKMMLTDLRGEISIEDEEAKSQEQQALISKILTLAGSSIEGDKPEDLNKVAEMLQPILAHTAIEESNIEKLTKIIENGYNINQNDKFGNTPLHFAIQNEKIEIVDFLLSQDNIKVDVEDSQKNSPLYYACLQSNEEIFSKLATKGAKLLTEKSKIAEIL
eukprot:CAMPEP_0196996146 /NCGR_PEP_ID=MMETSP1380-20130617/2107_1 /TAXON_ID=5936 /ORGANISM="Euplotes crassus, Strain CT5" /LENGTH=234 /DNA_ID=CAMNT_0042412029 /DNA_START=167 /DNA_END=872 /DNA_ORIENTATION=-